MLLGSDLAIALQQRSRGNTPESRSSTSSVGVAIGNAISGQVRNRLGNPSPKVQHKKSPLPHHRSTSILRVFDCKHFHYESVELGPVIVQLLSSETLSDEGTVRYKFSLESNDRKWNISRTFVELVEFDCQLHRCVFDRRHSRLVELSIFQQQHDAPNPDQSSSAEDYSEVIKNYANRLSQLTGSLMRCYPVLKFLELDSRGNHFIPIEQTQINTPAIAAAVAIKSFNATKTNHLNLRLGDIISIVEMGSCSDELEGSSGNCWWKGKLTVPSEQSENGTSQRPLTSENGHGGIRDSEEIGEFSSNKLIGYFPSNCVKLFSDKLTVDERQACARASKSGKPPRFHRWIPNENTTKPLIKSLFSVVLPPPVHNTTSTAPSPCSPFAAAKVFGVDLEIHLAETNLAIPFVLTECVRVIEENGIVTGIYRQCGIQSNIRRIRWEFENGRSPDWASILHDIHCVSSLLKQYFRQLPDPLFTYHLYNELIDAYNCELKDRIQSLREVIHRLPPAHFRTAKFLMNHLLRMSRHKRITDMSASNLAIVWAPNIIRCPPIGIGDNAHLLVGLDIHKSLCNFLILQASAIFGPELDEEEILGEKLSVSSEDHLSEGEVAAELSEYLGHKIRRESGSGVDQLLINVNGGPANLPAAFHTVLHRPSLSMDSSAHTEDSFSSWRRFINNSSFENSISNLWHRRSRLSRDETNAHSLKQAPGSRSRSVEYVQRNESMFSYFGRNLDGIRANVFRRIRSVRNNPSTRTLSKKEAKLVMESNKGPLIGLLEPSPSSASDSHTKDAIKPYIGDGQSSQTTPFIDEDLLAKDDCAAESHRKSSSAAKDMRHVVFSELRPPNQKKPMYAAGILNGQRRLSSTAASDVLSSTESLPLDVSRYDNVNVQNNVPSSNLIRRKHPNTKALRANRPLSISVCPPPPPPQDRDIIYYF